MAAFSWPASRQTVIDLNGDPVPGALLQFFLSGTSTPLTAYSDSALTTPLASTITADAYGRWPRVFLPYSDYRERVRTSAGVVLWDDDGIANPAPASSGGGSTTPDSELFKTGDPKWSFDTGSIEGFVRLNARTIGNAGSGATERANADTEALYIWLWNRLDNTVCPVSTGRGASGAADYAAGKTLGLPDARGRALFGIDTMGNTSAGRLGSATFSYGSGSLIGSYGGATAAFLAQANLPAIAPTITVNETTKKSISITTTGIPIGTGSTQTVVTNVLTAGGTTTVETTGTTTGSVTATSSNLGSGNGFSIAPPFLLVTWHLKL